MQNKLEKWKRFKEIIELKQYIIENAVKLHQIEQKRAVFDTQNTQKLPKKL